VTFDPKEYRRFDYGYAVTLYSFQGLTAGRVIANIDTDSALSLINTRLAYVSISRASDDARVYTNNAETLGERLATDITKTAAVDFLPPSPTERADRRRQLHFSQARQRKVGRAGPGEGPPHRLRLHGRKCRVSLRRPHPFDRTK